LVSVDSNGDQGNFDSSAPSISSDGEHIAFESLTSNLVTGDTNGLRDVFVHDLDTGTTIRISVDTNNNQSTTNTSSAPNINSDGSYVAFESLAGDLVTGDTNGFKDVFLRGP
jgi:Tol biopolymer transport system component